MANKSINKYNVAAINQSGKVGTIRYFQRGGETYVRSSHNSVKNNPRTDAQMRHRIMFASKAALWSALNGNLRGAFTKKEGTQSDFNGANPLQGGSAYSVSQCRLWKELRSHAQLHIPDSRDPDASGSLRLGNV